MGTRVLCCGTFDNLHPGHIAYLEQAATLGTELYVVVARDENVKRIKGRLPEQSEDLRKNRLAQEASVDRAYLGYPGNNFLKIVSDIKPDIIALGYDQKSPPGLAEAFPDCQIKILAPYHPEKYKSSIFRRTQEHKTTPPQP